MVVLLLFNAADRLSYREIQAATAIAPADLQRSLQSLACVKARAPRAAHQAARVGGRAGRLSRRPCVRSAVSGGGAVAPRALQP